MAEICPASESDTDIADSPGPVQHQDGGQPEAEEQHESVHRRTSTSAQTRADNECVSVREGLADRPVSAQREPGDDITTTQSAKSHHLEASLGRSEQDHNSSPDDGAGIGSGSEGVAKIDLIGNNNGSAHAATSDSKPTLNQPPGDPSGKGQCNTTRASSSQTLQETLDKSSLPLCFPRLFERVTYGALFEPKYDNPELETALELSFFYRTRQRFRISLAYIGFSSLCWTGFFAGTQYSDWPGHLAGALVIFMLTVIAAYATRFSVYRRHPQITAGAYACVLLLVLAASPLYYIAGGGSFDVPEGLGNEMNIPSLSPFTLFALSMEYTLIMYIGLPLPLYATCAIAICASVLLESLSLVGLSRLVSGPDGLHMAPASDLSVTHVMGKVMLHLCVHALGVHVYVMESVRRHSTFWTIGRSTTMRAQIKMEKKLTDDMIESLMPPMVAKKVMLHWKEDAEEASASSGLDGLDALDGSLLDEDEEQHERPPFMQMHRGSTAATGQGAPGSGEANRPGGDNIIFRPFWMEQMNNVSILFADIVGFTKMSSNKTAEHLVTLLNALFAKFDTLCKRNNCEKITTLGDCYYCVSGCPDARDDHAKCCVDMGLAMIEAIKEFDIEYNEDVNMRVGVHTGKVLCGIVGTRRFKFDVWSYDVDLANLMESTGNPGQVHISEATYQFLNGEYEVIPGQVVRATKRIRNTVENYDVEKSAFVVKQVEHSIQEKTYFIKEPVHPASGPPEDPNAHFQGDAGKDPVAADVSENVELFNREKPLTRYSGKTMAIDYDSGLIHSHLLGHRQKAILRRDSETSIEGMSPGGRSLKHVASVKSNCATKRSSVGDRQLIKSILDNKICEEYLHRTPVNPISQTFTDQELEDFYRQQYRNDLFKSPSYSDTLARPRYNGLADLILSCLFFVLLAIGSVLAFWPITLPAGIYLGLALAMLLGMLGTVVAFMSGVGSILSITPVSTRNLSAQSADVGTESLIQQMCRNRLYKLSEWLPLNIIGAVVLSLPVGLAYANWACSNLGPFGDTFFVSIVMVGLIHFLNLNMVSAWTRSLVATLFGATLVVLVFVPVCPSVTPPGASANSSAPSSNGSLPSSEDLPYTTLFSGDSPYSPQVALVIVLLLLLLWILNRGIEAGSRLAFFGHRKARMERRDIIEEKRKTEWLLANILPTHVAEQLRKSPSTMFSKSHKDIAVVFISIVNFDDFYEENFVGGKENLRVLNELFNDYEALFRKDEYKDVEKIKTIGSTFMAAAGLNDVQRAKNNDPKAHLYAMMDFCLEIIEVVKKFNEGMFNFNFVLKVGYHVGDVVSGIIGTTKLHYDIWGNTVNVASRMYSMGVTSRVQVTEETAQLLEDAYEFEFRDVIEVKGKGRMKAYLLKGKRGAVAEQEDAVFM